MIQTFLLQFLDAMNIRACETPSSYMFPDFGCLAFWLLYVRWDYVLLFTLYETKPYDLQCLVTVTVEEDQINTPISSPGAFIRHIEQKQEGLRPGSIINWKSYPILCRNMIKGIFSLF